ncbi:GMC family oxidoreductase [Nesterenkonia lutea]|uniref:Choline dehydrogenase n=1 Tax=Nesterenkonia lutea TaxID=272919 RepID=A0ABR9JFK4_9MICC|nr:GMC family oxidoreductase N-terminal domain-containing protein [Nesterenkonia lutea]MBE1524714.1 choline dehydrogenase [Nesterenkonia lutea]
MDETRTSDYVVIGAGSAGSVIARRLLDAGHSVHIIEAGGKDEDPHIHSPQGWPMLMQGPTDWALTTTPQVHADTRTIAWPRGKVLGGSGSLNGMIYIRGHRSDYDKWAAAGCEGWSWEDVLPLFKRSEDHEDGETEFHGAGGPLHVEKITHRHASSEAFVQAAGSVGISETLDFNGAHMSGAGFNHTTTKDGRRHSPWRAFIQPILGHDRLTVTTDALVHRIIVEAGRATGVEFSTDAGTRIARAEAEIVLCGGAIGSPAILQHSGIGDTADLAEAGIDSVLELPGVGKNLHDHVLASVIYEAPEALAEGRHNLLEAQLFAHSRQTEEQAPDIQPLFMHFPYPTDGGDAPAAGFTINAGIVRPRSRGTLRVTSPDPKVAPLLDPNLLADEYDLEALCDAIELCREIGAQEALAPYRKGDFNPSGPLTTRDQVRAHARAMAGTYHHQAGTCRMGTDDLSVVDPQLRVRGVAGLRVADASIMPAVPSGNTNAPTIMIGEKAADLLLLSR